LPDSPQEVRYISAQEDTARVPDPEAFANVGASVGQTTQHAPSFTSSLGLGCALGEPAPDFPRFFLPLPLPLPVPWAFQVWRFRNRRWALRRHAKSWILHNFNRNYAYILYRFRVIASYSSKVANFNLPHLCSVPHLSLLPRHLSRSAKLPTRLYILLP